MRCVSAVVSILLFGISIFVPNMSLATAGAASDTRPITVFAASSMKTVLEEIASLWTAGGVRFSFGASSILARQIQQGAPADLYVSASEAWMDVVEKDGLLVPETRRNFVGNRLVLIGPAADLPVDLGDPAALVARLGKTGRVALALVNAVPSGIYARQAFSSLGLWDTLSERTAQTDNVRAALALVAWGEAPLGVVYATDALAEPRVTVVAHFPDDSHAPIRYPVAAIVGGNVAQSRAFVDFLGTQVVRDVLDAHGFVTGPEQ